MFEIIMTVLFLWLVWQFIKLAFRVTWGIAKAVALVLFVLSLPVLIGCLLLTGGLFLLLPLALIGLALGILRLCL